MAILNEVIGGDLRPTSKGGVTFYPADSLERIFDWAEAAGRRIEWVEGVFYEADSKQGQLSLAYTCERHENYRFFREQCLSLIEAFQAEGAAKGMGAYFEIGVTD